MKRAGHLFEAVAELDNLLLAFSKAQRGKQGKAEVRQFRAHLHMELSQLRAELLEGKFRVGAYHTFKIYDPKERLICAAPFRERVLHHALMNVCEPVFEAYQIHDSYACRVGKGVYAALARAQQYARANRFYLKLDVRKYFDSIDHGVLLRLLERRFKDARVLELLAAIVASYAVTPGKGVPIGNLTSQYFANHYLGVLDHHVKERLRCGGYVRYMDDFVLWHDERGQLKRWRAELAGFLQEHLKLELKPPCLNHTTAGMSYLGYRVFPRQLRLTQRSRNRFRRKLRALDRKWQSGEWDEATAARRVLPLLAFAEHADTRHLRELILKEFEDSVQRPPTACCAAATGTTTPGTAGRLTGTTTTRTTATTTTGCAWSQLNKYSRKALADPDGIRSPAALSDGANCRRSAGGW